MSIVVVGERSFEIATTESTPRSVVLSVVVDGGDQWDFEVAGWRPWSCGVDSGQFYLWSAREIVAFLRPLLEPVVMEFDEDLLLVFRIESGWVLVCETSVRLLAECEEVVRIEFGEVIEAAAWRRECLIVRDASGSERSVMVDVSGMRAKVVD